MRVGSAAVVLRAVACAWLLNLAAATNQRRPTKSPTPPPPGGGGAKTKSPTPPPLGGGGQGGSNRGGSAPAPCSQVPRHTQAYDQPQAWYQRGKDLESWREAQQGLEEAGKRQQGVPEPFEQSTSVDSSKICADTYEQCRSDAQCVAVVVVPAESKQGTGYHAGWCDYVYDDAVFSKFMSSTAANSSGTGRRCAPPLLRSRLRLRLRRRAVLPWPDTRPRVPPCVDGARAATRTPLVSTVSTAFVRPPPGPCRDQSAYRCAGLTAATPAADRCAEPCKRATCASSARSPSILPHTTVHPCA